MSRGGPFCPEAGLSVPRRAFLPQGGPVCPEAGLSVPRRASLSQGEPDGHEAGLDPWSVKRCEDLLLSSEEGTWDSHGHILALIFSRKSFLKSSQWFPLRSEAAWASPPRSDYTVIWVTPRTVDQTAFVLDEVLSRGVVMCAEVRGPSVRRARLGPFARLYPG